MIAPSAHALPGPFLASVSSRINTRTESSAGKQPQSRVPSWIQRIVRLWFSLQLSHHGGRYSIERMIALDEYARNTSIWRVLLVCIGTPVPMVVLVLLQESIPLQDPAEGWHLNYGIWIRSGILGAVVTHGIAVHAMCMFDGVALSKRQLVVLAAVVGVCYVAVLLTIAAHWTFPIPFMGVSCSMALVALLVFWFRVIGGTNIWDSILSKPQLLLKFTGFVSTQLVMALIYPIYQVLFDYELETEFILPIILLLPVIKLTMKNLLTLSTSHLEDLMPESVVFTVDFFNALYVATCMQSATSTSTVAAVMAIDIAQSAIDLYEMHRTMRDIQNRLQSINATGNARSVDVLVVIRDLCDRFIKTGKDVPSDIKIESCLHAFYTVPKRIMACTNSGAEFNQVRPLASNSGLSVCVKSDKTDHPSPVVIHPTDPTPTRKTSTARKPSSYSTKMPSSGLTGTQLRALRHTLEVLFTSECILLTEYLEFVIPMLYGCFMLVAVNLPSAKYHTELDKVTPETVGGTVRSLFFYSILELLSFTVLIVLMRRSCGMRGLYHLAFVLETQMTFIQGKQLIWILMTLAFRVVHFGKWCMLL